MLFDPSSNASRVPSYDHDEYRGENYETSSLGALNFDDDISDSASGEDTGRILLLHFILS